MDTLNILCIRACLLKYTNLSYSLLILNILGLPHWANLPYIGKLGPGYSAIAWVPISVVLGMHSIVPYSIPQYFIVLHNA